MKKTVYVLLILMILVTLTACSIELAPSSDNTFIPDITPILEETSSPVVTATISIPEESPTDSPTAYSEDNILDLGLLSIALPRNMVKGETESLNVTGRNDWTGWKGIWESTIYTTDGMELLIIKYGITKETAQKYIEPLITEKYDTKNGRLSVLEAQTGQFLDQTIQEKYPFNMADTSSGGGRVLTRDGQPSQSNEYQGDEVQENYGMLTDGRQFVQRGGFLGTQAVLVIVITNNDTSYEQGQSILNTLTPLMPDVTMSHVRVE